MEEKTAIARYQFDITLPTGEMYHVREDNWEAFQIARDNVLKLIGKAPVKEQTESIQKEIPETDESYCSLHDVNMKERKGKRGEVFYSHSRQLPDESWDYCSGAGWNSEVKK